MNKSFPTGYLAIVFSLGALIGCARQNSRSISHLDTDASIQSGLPWRPEDGRVITTWVDANSSTMSTLYGNDVAVNSARSASDIPAYPAGSMVALVTWSQREDERWFGAKIPARVQLVEFETVRNGPANKMEYVYQRFVGGALKQTMVEASITSDKRATYLLSQRAAIMP
jgi:hypothetical protein